jgi:hypothetical protein
VARGDGHAGLGSYAEARVHGLISRSHFEGPASYMEMEMQHRTNTVMNSA